MKTLILIAGHMRSGKNTVGDMLSELFKKHDLTVTQDSFANGVKTGAIEDFKPLIDFLNDYADKLKSQIGSLTGFNKNLPEGPFAMIDSMLNQIRTKDDNWYNEKTPITRFLLQIYGTNIMRNRIDIDWWAKQLKERFISSISDITIVTDVRFPNEIEIFANPQDYRVITIRVERNINNNSVMASHESEIALDNWTSFDYIIENNSTLDELKCSVKTVVDDILNTKESTEYSFKK